MCSGAIAAGLPALGLATRPTDVGTLQAVAAVGQPRLMERFGAILAQHGLLAGQVLLTPHDFGVRSQYLHARETLRRLLDLGVVPDRQRERHRGRRRDPLRRQRPPRRARVAPRGRRRARAAHRHARPLHRRSPPRRAARRSSRRSSRSTPRSRRVAGGTGTDAGERRHGEQAGRGEDRGVVGRAGGDRGGRRARRGRPTRSTAGRWARSVRPRAERLSSRKLWIAFARGASGRIVVDDGARRALCVGQPLAAAGGRAAASRARSRPTTRSRSSTAPGAPFAKGLVRYSAAASCARSPAARPPSSPEGLPHEVVHRDDLVVLP